MEKKIIIGLVMLILLGATVQLFAKNAGSENPLIPSNLSQDISFKVYPNPATTHVSFSLIDYSESINRLNIYDAVGTLRYSKKFSKQDLGSSLDIDLTKFEKGVYFIQILGPNTQITRKLVIRK